MQRNMELKNWGEEKKSKTFCSIEIKSCQQLIRKMKKTNGIQLNCFVNAIVVCVYLYQWSSRYYVYDLCLNYEKEKENYGNKWRQQKNRK